MTAEKRKEMGDNKPGGEFQKTKKQKEKPKKKNEMIKEWRNDAQKDTRENRL